MMNIVLPLDKVGPLKAALSEYSDDMPLVIASRDAEFFVQAEIEVIGGMLCIKLNNKKFQTADETVAALNKEMVEGAPLTAPAAQV
jgi:hypothetical protein